jgi:pimeloyl-[acyl-carrier protein] methyl ester esterase
MFFVECSALVTMMAVKKLVLLPGMDGSVELLRGFVAALPEGFEAETLWYPADVWMSFRDLAGTLRGSLPVEEPFVLVAESYGAALAILVAAMEPPNLQGVVLCSGYATTPLRGWRRVLAIDTMRMLAHFTIPGWVARYLMVGDEAPGALVQSVTDAVSWVTPKVLAGRVREALHVDVRGELAEVKVPVMYLQPTRDRLVDAGCLAEMRAVKVGEVVEIMGPHLILEAEPALCAEVVASFVEVLRGRRR